MGLVVAIGLSALVGAAIVVQNGVIAELMKTASLWLLIATGNLIVAVAAISVFLAHPSRGAVSEELGKIPLAVLIPGFCGLAITAGMPLAIARIGVFTTVMIVIACQIIAGLAWDRFYAGEDIRTMQLLGAALIAAGVLLVLRPPSS